MNRYRKEAYLRRVAIKHHFSKSSNASSGGSTIPSIDQDVREERVKTSIAHQWYLKAVEKINKLRDQINNKKQKRESDSIIRGIEGQSELRVMIENVPALFSEQDWMNEENLDMSDVEDLQNIQ